MRILLDAHLSPKRIAAPLRRLGHDVFALAEARELDGLTDPQVLELAAVERRVLVTRNAKDCAPLLRVWAEAGRHHGGCILVWSLPHDAFAPIVRGVARFLDAYPTPTAWIDRSVAI